MSRLPLAPLVARIPDGIVHVPLPTPFPVGPVNCYILLDEPLNNLDMKHAVAMMGQLRCAADELGKTFVIVIHDINFAAAYADNIVALTDGQLAHSGSPSELMTTETLEQVFGTPIQVRDDGDYPLAVYYR